MIIGTIALQPLVALIAGILILVVPRLLNFIVAIYLIFLGVTGLWPELLKGHFPGVQGPARPAAIRTPR